MRRPLGAIPFEIPFLGTLVLYHCDGCGRRRPGWEDRRPRRWAEFALSPEGADPGEETVLHECLRCRRAWGAARHAHARDERRDRAARDAAAENGRRADGPGGGPGSGRAG